MGMQIRGEFIFEFLDVVNPSVNPYGNFMVSLKIDVFLPLPPPFIP
jgi:hypothetical protein